MAKARAAVAKAQEGVGAPPEPTAQPKTKRGRPKAAAAGQPVEDRVQTKLAFPKVSAEEAAAAAAAVAAATAEPVVIPAPPVTVAATKTKRAPKKAAPAASAEPTVVLAQATTTTEIPDATILRIVVKKTMICDRNCYLEPKKQKVYDLKFKYLGRYDSQEEKIVDFPDSDVD